MCLCVRLILLVIFVTLFYLHSNALVMKIRLGACSLHCTRFTQYAYEHVYVCILIVFTYRYQMCTFFVPRCSIFACKLASESQSLYKYRTDMYINIIFYWRPKHLRNHINCFCYLYCFLFGTTYISCIYISS